MKIKKIISCSSLLLLMPLLLMLTSLPAYSEFGDTCSLYPVNADYATLKDKNLYGYVQSQIDMTTYVPAASGCNVNDGSITICLATPGLLNQNPPCELIKFNVGDKKKIYDAGVVSTQSANHVLKNVEFYAALNSNDICVFMSTSQGEIPVACKKNGAVTTIAPTVIHNCKVSTSCYDEKSNFSKSLFNFSGKAIHCVRETLDKVLNPEEECLNEDSEVFLNINPFSYFQDSLKTAIRAALIIYVLFFGIRIVLNPYQLELNEIIIFVLKAILVLYFAVGIGRIEYFAGSTKVNDGTTQFALPILLQIINDFPTMIFDATEISQVCNFSPSEYPTGYGFYALWDSFDCRIAYYFGGEILTLKSGAPTSALTQVGDKFHGAASFYMVPLIFLMFLGGQIILIIFIVIFMAVFLSLCLFFISSYLVCLTCIYAMAYLAPIFIPMALFEKTKSYFDSWLRVTLSFAFQPMIFASFMAILMVFYDTAVFGNCQFQVEEIDGIKHFQFTGVDSECEKTFGYKIYDTIKNGRNLEDVNAILFNLTIYKDVFTSTGVLFMNTIFMVFLSIVFFFFSKVIAQFAADLTGGVGVGAVAMDPTLIMSKSKNAASSMKNAFKSMKSGNSGKGGDGGGGGDNTGRGGAGGGSAGGGSNSSPPPNE
jgi:type IV secretion system protein VirB6